MMKRFPHGILIIVLMLVAPLVIGCGSKRRKPVLSDTPQSTAAPSDQQAEGTRSQPLDGPDVQSVSDDYVRGQDIAGEETAAGPLADVRFEYNSAALTPEAQALLRSHSIWLQDHPSVQVRVEGHCDERGTVEYNLALGEQRARSVFDFLTELGIAGSRLMVVSLGKERPLDPGSNEAAWAKNRRVHFAPMSR